MLKAAHAHCAVFIRTHSYCVISRTTSFSPITLRVFIENQHNHEWTWMQDTMFIAAHCRNTQSNSVSDQTSTDWIVLTGASRLVCPWQELFLPYGMMNDVDRQVIFAALRSVFPNPPIVQVRSGFYLCSDYPGKQLVTRLGAGGDLFLTRLLTHGWMNDVQAAFTVGWGSRLFFVSRRLYDRKGIKTKVEQQSSSKNRAISPSPIRKGPPSTPEYK